MITQAQAAALVDSCEYRDWKIQNLDPTMFGSLDMAKIIRFIGRGKVPVVITYTAPNSEPGQEHTDVINTLYIALPLTETEAQFARALYEAIGIVEEHERREFFKIGYGVIDHRTVEKGSRAVFHPHGFRRNKMFHDLDPFAETVEVEALATGQPMTADAVA